MGELKKTTFKEFVTLQRGFDLPKRNMNPGIYPVIGSTSIIGYHDEFKVDPPGVVTGRSGALGSVQYIPVKYWPHNTSLWIKDFKGNFPKYVYYFLQTLGLQYFNSGAAVPTLNRNDLDTLELKIHNLSTQRKIAAVLSVYDDLIENNTRRIEILEEMAQAIYREWFVEFRFPGHEQVPMVESELGLIPQGWEVKQLSDVTSVITKGTTPTTLGKQFASEGINFIKVQSIDEQGDILDSRLAKIDDKTHELLKRSQLQENDILFSIAGAIGRAATVPRRFLPANTNQALAIIRPLDLSFTPYLYRTLRSSEFLNYSLERVVQTAQANVSLSVLSSAPVIVPMKAILDDFNKNLTPITNFVDVLREKNTNLRQTRDLLLPKLISGEIDVSKEENHVRMTPLMPMV